MNMLETFIDWAPGLFGLTAIAMLALGFWKARMLGHRMAARIGIIACGCELGLLVITISLWACSTFLPPGSLLGLYSMPLVWQTTWYLSAACHATILLCLAWILHRGLAPSGSVKGAAHPVETLPRGQ